jgi:hypothetical protein
VLDIIVSFLSFPSLLTIPPQISHLRHEPAPASSSYAPPRRRVVIEEEIVNDHEGPRILYPSTARPRHTTTGAPPRHSPPRTQEVTHPAEVTREIEGQSLPQQRPQQQQQEGREDEESYKYNLVIDDHGTRWMPIPEASPPVEETHFPVEKYSLPRESSNGKGRGQGGGRAGGGGGHLGETRESILEILDDDAPSLVIVENKASSLPLPSHPTPAATASDGTKGGGAAADQVPASSSAVREGGGRGVDRGPMAWGQGGDRYREVPLRRGEVQGVRGGSGQEEEGWGGDRYVAPYVSRVKIHSKPREDESPSPAPPPAPALLPPPQETASTNTSVSSASREMPESRQDLMELLKLLVSTQQQTLQVSSPPPPDHSPSDSPLPRDTMN